MSPELVQKRPYDPFKADIWAFGIMLYWIVLGYFPQDNPPKKSQHIQRNSNYSYNPRSNKKFKLFDLQFPKDMHPGIEYLLMKMLEEDPIERVNAKDILYHTWIRPVQLKKEIKKLTGLIAK